MSKWDSFRGSVTRLHDDFQFPLCVFENYVQTGITDGQPTGTYYRIGELRCEFVPPRADASVDSEGTHLGFDTSIRLPTPDLNSLLPDTTFSEDTTIPSGSTESYDSVTIQAGVTLTVDGTLIANEITINGTLTDNGDVFVPGELSGDEVPYGVDGERPTRVIPQVAENEVYEVEAVVPEHGSDMRLIRLTEV
jgi:hypothetical protein